MSQEKEGIEDFRLEIDRIDLQLLDLLNRRAQCALSIGKIKKKNNQPIHVPEREEQVLARMVETNQGPLPAEGVRELFQEVFRQMKLLEGMV